MKKIINGKKYDTDTANKLAYYSNGLSISDFNHKYEALYVKRTGEYFLYGLGGAMTEYREVCGDGSFCGGEDIKPLSESEAKAWVEKYANYEYESTFGECAE